MIVVILLSILPLCFKQTSAILNGIDFFCLIIFIVDYFLRWVTADYKYNKKSFGSYVRYPFGIYAIIDIVSILPSISILNNGFKVLRIFGSASGVCSASLWNSTIEPFLTLLVTLWQILSGVALSFQSSESPLDTKVKSFLSYFNIFNYIIFLLKNQYNTLQPITRQNGTTQGSTTTTHYNSLQD